LDTNTGSLLWKHKQPWSDQDIPADLLASRDRLYVTLGDGAIRAFSMDSGGPLWTGPPACVVKEAAGGTHLLSVEMARKITRKIKEYDVLDGTSRWCVDLPGEMPTEIAIWGDLFFVSTSANTWPYAASITALALCDGKELWTAPLEMQHETARIAVDTDSVYVALNPGQVDGNVDAAHRRGKIVALDQASGKLRWVFTVPEGSARSDLVNPYEVYDVLVFGETVLARVAGGQIVAVDKKTGSLMWSIPTREGIAGDLLVSGKHLIVVFGSEVEVYGEAKQPPEKASSP
jgi:outer membrane protein assembly factor BamB